MDELDRLIGGCGTPLASFLLDSIEEGLYILDLDMRIRYWSPGAERITGRAPDDVLGRTCSSRALEHVDEDGSACCDGKCRARAILADGRPRAAFLAIRHRNGWRVPVSSRMIPLRSDDGRIVGLADLFSDRSEHEKNRELLERYRSLSLVDPLTGVLNRRGIETCLDARMDEFTRHQWPFGIAFFDIDGFKQINDRHGHEVGDRVLVMVSRTLSLNIRSEDAVGRWGGEEFVVLFANAHDGELAPYADRLRMLVETSRLDGFDGGLGVTVSAGVAAITPQDTRSSLVDRADRCMYAAKRGGGNGVAVCSGC